MSHTAAIILSGGSGKRMNMSIPKQYMKIHGHPLISYTIKAFEESSVDEIILVTGKEDITFCREQIVELYGFHKVSAIVAGGKERYDSVYQGLLSLNACDYVLIHDGARACITKEVIERTLDNVRQYQAAVAAVPVKDTIKQASEDGFVEFTPNRNSLWQIQTPQAFCFESIRKAYENMYISGDTGEITDDSMVMEQFGEDRIKLFFADYNNIKITTPEDISIVSTLLKGRI